MAERIPFKLGQIMLEMRGALLAAVTHRGGKIISIECVRRWHDQLTELMREYEAEKPDHERATADDR